EETEVIGSGFVAGIVVPDVLEAVEPILEHNRRRLNHEEIDGAELLDEWFCHGPEIQSVIQPSISQLPCLIRERMACFVVAKPNPILCAQQRIDRTNLLHERPTRSAVGTFSTQNQKRTRGNQGHDLMMLHLGNVLLHVFGEIPWI